MPKEVGDHPPIRDIVELVNDLASKRVTSIETPCGARLILPALPKDAPDELVQKLAHHVEELEFHLILFDILMGRVPSRAVVRDPARPANEPSEPDLDAPNVLDVPKGECDVANCSCRRPRSQ